MDALAAAGTDEQRLVHGFAVRAAMKFAIGIESGADAGLKIGLLVASGASGLARGRRAALEADSGECCCRVGRRLAAGGGHRCRRRCVGQGSGWRVDRNVRVSIWMGANGRSERLRLGRAQRE